MTIIAKSISFIKEDVLFKKQLIKFLFAGFSAVAIDMGTYYFLLNFLTHSPAKAISFLCGTFVAYLLNKFWTFEQNRKSISEIMRFVILYTITLGVNVAVNKITLIIFPIWTFFAFLTATGASTVLNFIGQKWWVFR